MIRKVFSWIFGLFLIASISWIAVFGFIKTNFSGQIQVSSSNDLEEIYDYITNPNLFPEWIQGYSRSQRVTSPSDVIKSIYLVSIEEDGEEFKVIYTTENKREQRQLLQKVEHPFYEMNAKMKLTQNTNSEQTILIELRVTGEGFVSQLLAPFYISEVLEDYKKQYQLAIKAIQ